LNSSLLIVALQTGSAASASEEYIEIANISPVVVDLTTVRLEYFASTPKSFVTPSRTIRLQGNLQASAHYKLTSTGYLIGQGQQVFSATLASAGGHVRLMDGSTERDFVGWGTAIMNGAHGHPAPAPPAGKSLLRTQDGAGTFIETNDNSQDFELETDTIQAQGVDSSTGYLELSELLPDPTSPANDATGEYIELHNSGVTELNLSGYILRNGSKNFKLPQMTVLADGYVALYAPQTKLTLANSGATIQLLTSSGKIVDETTYSKAIAGSSWAWDGSDWSWTAIPTPNRLNEFEDPVLKKAISSTATKNKPIVKKTTSSIKKKTQKKSPKKTQVKGVSTADGVKASQDTSSNRPAPLHSGVIAGVGSLALLYGAYEYRTDITNTFQKLRRNRGNRP